MSRRPLANMLSASTTDIPAASPAAVGARRAPDGRYRLAPVLTQDVTLSSGRFYLLLAIGALAIGGISLLVPSSPSYDPWSWLVWGREIIHLNLKINTTGTSWKPLPMIFTIPFALFGKAAPNLWLVVARAGAFAAAAMAFRIAYRLTRQVAAAGGDESGRGVAATAPALLAGGIAALSMVFTGTDHYVSSNALGYSEGFATALLFIAFERHLDGHPRQAFVVCFFVALDRPELWALLFPYGLWLGWRDRGARALVLALFVAQPVLWFLPVYWGSGHLGSSVTRATNPRANSLAYAKFPFWAELKRAAWPTVLLRVKLLAGALVVALAAMIGVGARRQGTDALRTPKARALLAAALCGLAGLAWFVIIALETQDHFSGNDRYLVIGSALVAVCGGVGFGWLAIEIARGVAWLRARTRRGAAGSTRTRSDSRGGAALVATTAVIAAAFVFAPNFIGPSLISIPKTHGSLIYQANLRKAMSRLIADYGGRRKVLACGQVTTEGFQVPMVAWYLHTHTQQIGAPPAAGAKPGPAPNLILQTADTRGAAVLPFLSEWPQVAYHHVATSGPVNLLTHCAPAAS